MIKGAIFDMDGTLLDSMHLWIDIGPRYLERIGKTWDEQIKNDTKLMLLPEMSKYFQSRGLINISTEDFIADVNKMVEEGYYNDVVIKPGVKDFLEELKNRNIPMILATATDRHLVNAVLKRNGIDNYFKEIFTCTEVGADKKVTTIFDIALKSLGTTKDNTYIFEDTLTPIETCFNAGYKVVAVYDKWSKRHTDKIKASSILYVEKLSDIEIDKL